MSCLEWVYAVCKSASLTSGAATMVVQIQAAYMLRVFTLIHSADWLKLLFVEMAQDFFFAKEVT